MILNYKQSPNLRWQVFEQDAAGNALKNIESFTTEREAVEFINRGIIDPDKDYGNANPVPVGSFAIPNAASGSPVAVQTPVAPERQSTPSNMNKAVEVARPDAPKTNVGGSSGPKKLHTVTQEDLDMNPYFAKLGVPVGAEVDYNPAYITSGEEAVKRGINVAHQA